MTRAARGAGRGVPFRAGTALVVGNYLPSLAAVRSLAAAGYRVIAGDGGEYATVDRSRSCHEVWKHPPIHLDVEFLTALESLLERRPDISVLLPLRPDYVKLLALHRQRLPARVVVASPEPDVVLTCLDKERMYAIASEVGVPHHATRQARGLSELLAVSEEVGFPCVVRPVTDTGRRLSGDRKAVICSDRSTLEDTFMTWPEGHSSLLVQRYVSGFRHNLYFAARRGVILAQVQTRILRTDRIDGTGLAVEGTSVAPDPRLTRYAAALVGRLAYTGIGFAQFLVPEHGELHFLEINPRHAGSTAIADHCGLDLTRIAIELASGEERWLPAGDFHYPAGRRYVWTSRDLFGLGLAFSRSEVDRRAGLRWLSRTVVAAARRPFHLSWSWRDPVPTLSVYWNLAKARPWRLSRR